MSCKVCREYSGASSLCMEHQIEKEHQDEITRLKEELKEAREEISVMDKNLIARDEKIGELIELIKEAIDIGQPEPVSQKHAEQMDEWLEKAKRFTRTKDE